MVERDEGSVAQVKEVDDLVGKWFPFVAADENGRIKKTDVLWIAGFFFGLSMSIAFFNVVSAISIFLMATVVFVVCVVADECNRRAAAKTSRVYRFDAWACVQTKRMDIDVVERTWYCPGCDHELKALFVEPVLAPRLASFKRLIENHVVTVHAAKGVFPFYKINVRG